jgi:transcriptional regulator with PAS, ATPase and Fis domain
VFLDEVGDLGPELQPKLLRVLEKREIRRLGSNLVKGVDVRIVSATNRKLRNEVNAGRFREDLYFRLSIAHIDLPPLCKRKEDIPLLTLKFLKEFHGDDALEHTVDFDKTMEAFRNHDWPGNVRELRNLVEIASYSDRRPIDLGAFLYLGRLKTQQENRPDYSADRPFKEVKNQLIREFEGEYLRDLLTRHDGNVSRAAREAGIERAYLQRLIRKHDLRSREPA